MKKNTMITINDYSATSSKRGWTGLLLFAFCLQMFSFSLNAQSLINGNEDKPKVKTVPTNSANNSKIAPDLQENVDELFFESRPDQTQKVIIKYKDQADSEVVNNGIILSDLATQNKINTKLGVLGGRSKKSFSKMGMISAELPLSKIRQLSEDENIEYISPDRPIKSSYSHYYETTGARDGYSEISGLNVDGTGIGVAVLDSGIDTSHNLIKSGTGHPGVVYSKSFTGASATVDSYGHGTHVASLLSGSQSFKSNGYGGIAPGVSLINLAVLDSNGQGASSNVIAALDWSVANKTNYNIRIITMSLGTAPKDSYKNDPLCQAARRAFNAGIVVVASAGNYGKDNEGRKVYGGINSPGIEPSVITVGAANSLGSDYRSDDTLTTYSSRGPTRGYKVVNNQKVYDNLIKPDLVAPGNKLVAAASTNAAGNPNSIINQNPSLYANYSGTDQLMYMSGSSMSTPLVTGATAMMLQANPNLTPNLVKAVLMFTAQQLQGYNSLEQGAGLLNVEGAIKMTKYIKSNVSSLSNGNAMLTGSTYYHNTIKNEICYWSQGVITNYGFLQGENLMTLYQGMYGNGVIMGDSTPFVNGQMTRLTSLTTSGLSLYSGSLTSNGVLMGDGYQYLSGNSMADGTTLGQGVVMGDGVLISDGVIMGDGVLIGDAVIAASLLGDQTAHMQP